MSETSAPRQEGLSLVLFAYNEEENIEPVLGELLAWLEKHEPRTEIIFVDDGSTDRTSERASAALARWRAVMVRHETNRGIGAALKSGVRRASRPWVTFLPADGQIEPEAIGTLRAAAVDGTVDVVLSLYEHRDDGPVRGLLSWGVRTLINVVHGVQLASDGPYLFRRELFDPDVLVPDTFFLNFEFPIRVMARGLPTRTVTIRCRPRRAGTSKSVGVGRVAGVARDLFELKWRRLQGR